MRSLFCAFALLVAVFGALAEAGMLPVQELPAAVPSQRSQVQWDAPQCYRCPCAMSEWGVCRCTEILGPCIDIPKLMSLRSMKTLKDCSVKRRVKVCDHKSLSDIRCEWRCR
jgi:hypothetical protein